jgi:hypothetical protein
MPIGLQGVDYVSIDPVSQRILSYAYDPDQLRKVSIPMAAMKACSTMELTTDYRDACIYILSRHVINLIKCSNMSSIKVCPHLVHPSTHTALHATMLHVTAQHVPALHVASFQATVCALVGPPPAEYAVSSQLPRHACSSPPHRLTPPSGPERGCSRASARRHAQKHAGVAG